MAAMTAAQFREMFPNANNEPITKALATGLNAVREGLDPYKIPESVPLLGGQSAADLTGFTGAAGVVEDFSRGNLQSGDMRMFDLLGLAAGVAPAARTVVKGGGLLGKEALRQMNEGTGLLGRGTINPRINIVPANVTKQTNIGKLGFDTNFDPRILEQDRLNKLKIVYDAPNIEIPKASLVDYEGHPFITSMSDRTNVGTLNKINDVPVNVNMQGGQDYMFNNAGQVWASHAGPVTKIIENAKVLKQTTGKDPLYLPWRMAPTGGDFANMTGETMLQYLSSNISKTAQKGVNKDIKTFIPDFKGIGSEEGMSQFRSLPDKQRKALKNLLDKKYRNEGGLSIGEARLAVADPRQLTAPQGGLQNVGRIFADNPAIKESGHAAYPQGISGEGIGLLDRDIRVYEMLKDASAARGIINQRAPTASDIRALQMKPYSGIIDEKMLKGLGY